MVFTLYKRLMRVGFLLFLVTAALSFAKAPHPFFVSVTEMEHNAKDNTVEISCKVFTDDFEKALTKMANQKVDLYHPKDKTQLDKWVTQYIQTHLNIMLDGKKMPLQFVGFEIEDQSTISYFQIDGVSVAPKKVVVDNTIFYDQIDKQIQIVHCLVGGNRKSSRVVYPEERLEFSF